MSYQALARTWRPRRFAEITGQSHVVRALTNALEHDRIHHAYLFTGTRGVGKTTIARILAKALNCEQLQGTEPCCQCAACLEVEAGRFVDLIEVDAASRTKVEDTRDLLENAQYSPSCGRYKIYLIDEVHMLSGHSFNALLKTLEEPPAHVKFLLATTDPQKIPVTVLSRCLQFNLKKLPPDQIGARLVHVLQAEGIEFQAQALQVLTRAADGSLRDALSLLDQAIVHGGGRIEVDDVESMLGGVSRRSLEGLVEALAAGDPRILMDEFERLSEIAPDYPEILMGLLDLLYRIALTQQLPDSANQDEAGEWLRAQAQAISPEDVQLFYQIGISGAKDLPWAPEPRIGLEMILLRMLAFRPANGTSPAEPCPVEPTASSSQTSKTRKPSEQGRPSAAAENLPNQAESWPELVERLRLMPGAKELASYCTLASKETSRWVLLLSPQHDHLHTPRRVAALEKAIQAFVGKPVKLEIQFGASEGEVPAQVRERQQQAKREAAEQAIAEDETVKALIETFDAEILPNATKPLE